MNCFKHPNVPAVGLCKFCQKGLCQECAHDLEHGLACKEHIQDVTSLNALLTKEKTTLTKVPRSNLEIVFWVGGVVIITEGVIAPIIMGSETMAKTSMAVVWAGVGSLLLSGVLFLMKLYTNRNRE